MKSPAGAAVGQALAFVPSLPDSKHGTWPLERLGSRHPPHGIGLDGQCRLKAAGDASAESAWRSYTARALRRFSAIFLASRTGTASPMIDSFLDRCSLKRAESGMVWRRGRLPDRDSPVVERVREPTAGRRSASARERRRRRIPPHPTVRRLSPAGVLVAVEPQLDGEFLSAPAVLGDAADDLFYFCGVHYGLVVRIIWICLAGFQGNQVSYGVPYSVKTADLAVQEIVYPVHRFRSRPRLS